MSVEIYNPKRYECHVTIAEPVDSAHVVSVVARFSQEAGFEFDGGVIITGAAVTDESYNGLLLRARGLKAKLYDILGVKVSGIKVEEILFDEKYGVMVR